MKPEQAFRRADWPMVGFLAGVIAVTAGGGAAMYAHMAPTVFENPGMAAFHPPVAVATLAPHWSSDPRWVSDPNWSSDLAEIETAERASAKAANPEGWNEPVLARAEMSPPAKSAAKSATSAKASARKTRVAARPKAKRSPRQQGHEIALRRQETATRVAASRPLFDAPGRLFGMFW
jgi:hypothetical protein